MSLSPAAAVPPGRLSKGWRRAVLGVHVLCSVGWIGVDLALVVLLVGATTSGPATDQQAVESAVQFVVPRVVPALAGGMLVTGLLLGWGTQWGLLSHTWVVVKLALGVGITALVYVRLVPWVFGIDSRLAGPAKSVQDALDRVADVPVLPLALSLHVLGFALVLSYWKPAGRTSWTERRAARRQRRRDARQDTRQKEDPWTP